MGAAYGSRWSVWDMRKLQGGKPVATGQGFIHGTHRFRYVQSCHSPSAHSLTHLPPSPSPHSLILPSLIPPILFTHPLHLPTSPLLHPAGVLLHPTSSPSPLIPPSTTPRSISTAPPTHRARRVSSCCALARTVCVTLTGSGHLRRVDSARVAWYIHGWQLLLGGMSLLCW